MADPMDATYKYFVRTADKNLIEDLGGTEVGTTDTEVVFVTDEMKEKDFLSKAKERCSFIRILA